MTRWSASTRSASTTADSDLARVVGLVLDAAALITIAYNALTGAVADRIRNPAVEGAPRPEEPLFGFHRWIALHQIGTVVMMVVLVTVFISVGDASPATP